MAQKNKLPQVARLAIRENMLRMVDTELQAYASDIAIKIDNALEEIRYQKEVLRMAEAELERRRRGSSGQNIVG